MTEYGITKSGAPDSRTTIGRNSDYEKLQRLADAFVEDILQLSDAEVMSEVLEDALAARLASWLRPDLDAHYVARALMVEMGRVLRPDTK